MPSNEPGDQEPEEGDDRTALDMTPEDLTYQVARSSIDAERVNTLDLPRVFPFST